MLNKLIKYIKFFWKSETLFTKRVSSMETNWKHYKAKLWDEFLSRKILLGTVARLTEYTQEFLVYLAAV